MDDLWCDVDVLIPCDLAAFEEAALTLLLILAIGFCVSFAVQKMYDGD